jgi:hypothetical protein
MKAILSPNRLFDLELYGSESQKAFVIDTAVKASQKTVLFGHKYLENISV